MKLTTFIKTTVIALGLFVSSGIIARNTDPISDGGDQQDYQVIYFKTHFEAVDFCSQDFTHCVSIVEIPMIPRPVIKVTYWTESNPGVCADKTKGCK